MVEISLWKEIEKLQIKLEWRKVLIEKHLLTVDIKESSTDTAKAVPQAKG